MAPPSGTGVPPSSVAGKGDTILIPFVIPVGGSQEPPSVSREHRTKTAESLNHLSQNCTDSYCLDAQRSAGEIIFAQYPPDADPSGEENGNKVDGGLGGPPSLKNNNVYQLLAKGLSLLVEGKILDAKIYLEPIRDNPIAKELMERINRNDDWLVSLQTLFILKALCDDEILAKRTTPDLPRIQAFLEEVESQLKLKEGADIATIISTLSLDPSKNYSEMPRLLEKLAGGVGGEILNTATLPRDTTRGEALMGLVKEKLLPSDRAGTAYVIARMLDRHPLVGEEARNLIMELNGVKTSPHRIAMEILDQGGTYFLASYLSILPARWLANYTWARWAAKYGPKMSRGRRILGLGAAWGASTATYIASEKILLGLSGYDGQILPKSGEELLRELLADLAVTGSANLLGMGQRWLSKKIFKDVHAASWLIKAGRHALRAPGRLLFLGLTSFTQGALLHFNHRWQDNTGFFSRFRPGKPSFLMPDSSQSLLLKGYEIKSAERTLGRLLNHLLTVRFSKDDKLYGRVHSLKQWIGKLDPAASPAQEETMLGVFWVAQERGVLGCIEGSKTPCTSGGAPDILLKWTKQKRYEKVNEYFKKHGFPMKVSPEGEFQLFE